MKNDKLKVSIYEIQPKTNWNYELLRKTIDKFSENAVVASKSLNEGCVWNTRNTPVSITLKGKRYPPDSWWKE